MHNQRNKEIKGRGNEGLRKIETPTYGRDKENHQKDIDFPGTRQWKQAAGLWEKLIWETKLLDNDISQ